MLIQSVTVAACTWAILGMSIHRHYKTRYNNNLRAHLFTVTIFIMLKHKIQNTKH